MAQSLTSSKPPKDSLPETHPTISVHCLPPSDFAEIRDASFFTRNGPAAQLPSPEDVRARAGVDDPTSTRRWERFPTVRYEELGLAVKFGPATNVTAAEGQCLWALRRALPAVPVPEVYGWTHNGGQVFIYMELVRGLTLEQRWESLDQADRKAVCEELRVLISEVRRLRHAPGEFFLGHINREPFGDIMFTNENRPPAGPFSSVREFHDWISNTIKDGLRHHWPGKELDEIPDPYRAGLPDDAEVVFTHADLHPSNIMVSTSSPCRIVALIDWRQSGWYPDYWEFCKAAYTAEPDGEWMDMYIPLFLQEPSCVGTWDDYAMAFGY